MVTIGDHFLAPACHTYQAPVSILMATLKGGYLRHLHHTEEEKEAPKGRDSPRSRSQQVAGPDLTSILVAQG